VVVEVKTLAGSALAGGMKPLSTSIPQIQKVPGMFPKEFEKTK
jgi:hypothetical protein